MRSCVRAFAGKSGMWSVKKPKEKGRGVVVASAH